MPASGYLTDDRTEGLVDANGRALGGHHVDSYRSEDG